MQPPKLGRRFERALLFALRKHAGQTRKKTAIPYFSHLMAVCSLVLEAGGDEDLAIAALLHDVVEDHGGSPMLKQVRRKFGKRVADIVEACSDSFESPKPPWRQRKLDYLKRLRNATADDRLVSAADKLHNVRSILSDYHEAGESIWERFTGKRSGTLWYYRALGAELGRNPENRLARELARAIHEMENTVTRKKRPSRQGSARRGN